MSYKQGDEIHIEDDEASAGSKPGVVRWVLGISLLAAVLLMSAIWIFGAIGTQDEVDESSRTGVEEETSSESMTTDPVLTDEDNDPSEIEATQDEQVNGLEVVE
ncbi:MAG: hypothetical protein WBA68_05525 [Alteraurantiacibacter sp.]